MFWLDFDFVYAHQGCVNHNERQERVQHHIGRSILPPPSLTTLLDSLAVPPMISALLLIAACPHYVSSSELLNAQIPHCALKKFQRNKQLVKSRETIRCRYSPYLTQFEKSVSLASQVRVEFGKHNLKGGLSTMIQAAAPVTDKATTIDVEKSLQIYVTLSSLVVEEVAEGTTMHNIPLL